MNKPIDTPLEVNSLHEIMDSKTRISQENILIFRDELKLFLISISVSVDDFIWALVLFQDEYPLRDHIIKWTEFSKCLPDTVHQLELLWTPTDFQHVFNLNFEDAKIKFFESFIQKDMELVSQYSMTDILKRIEDKDWNYFLGMIQFWIENRIYSSSLRRSLLDMYERHKSFSTLTLPSRADLRQSMWTSAPRWQSNFYVVLWNTIKKISSFLRLIENKDLYKGHSGLFSEFLKIRYSYNSITNNSLKQQAPSWEPDLNVHDLPPNPDWGLDYQLYMTSFLKSLYSNFEKILPDIYIYESEPEYVKQQRLDEFYENPIGYYMEYQEFLRGIELLDKRDLSEYSKIPVDQVVDSGVLAELDTSIGMIKRLLKYWFNSQDWKTILIPSKFRTDWWWQSLMAYMVIRDNFKVISGNKTKRASHPTSIEALEWSRRICTWWFTWLASPWRVYAILRFSLGDIYLTMKQKERITTALEILGWALSGSSLGDISGKLSLESRRTKNRVDTSWLSAKIVAILEKHYLVNVSPDEVRREQAINAITEIKNYVRSSVEDKKERVDRLLSDLNEVFWRKAIAKRMSVRDAVKIWGKKVIQHMWVTK